MVKRFLQFAACLAVCLIATGAPAALHLRLDHADGHSHHGCDHPCEPADRPGEPHEGCAVCIAIAHLQADADGPGAAPSCFELRECDRVTASPLRVVCQHRSDAAARGPPSH